MDGEYHPAATNTGHPDTRMPMYATSDGQNRNYPDHLPIQNTSGSQERNYLNLPDSPGYLQTIGDRTSLPGSPRYDRTPSSPQYDQAPIIPEDGGETEQRDTPVRLAQAKVVLLGSVAAGKTSLLNTLRHGESRLAMEGPEGRTIGIEVHSVALQPDTKLWFYDFGGHDTYHFSQQLFLTQRAIYLLAVDVSIYDAAKFEKTLRHWYTILTSRLVTPVICLLATHIDLCSDREEMGRCCQDMHEKLMRLEEAHQAKLQQELQRLKQEIMADQSDDPEHIRRFQPRTLRQPMQRLNLLLANRPRIFHSVCCISSKTLEGMEEFRHSLVSIVTDNESLFPQKDVPHSWINLSDAIVSMKEDVPFVTMTEFMAMAQQFRIVGDHVQRVLSYLQSVGLVLHYQDYRQNSDLSKYVFVNPNLLLAIFGLVFNHNYFMDETRFVWKHKSILRLPHFDFVHLRKNLKERGIIGEKLLKCFWDAMGISDEVYQAIVPLLEKFDLCYEIRIKPGDAVVEGRHFLFPYLLNKRKPPEVDFMWSDDLLDNFTQVGVELSFSQPHLPFGFLEKVLIRAHTYVDHCLSWKQGMVAFCDEGQDLVRIENKTDSEGHALLTLSARVRLDRKSMARHIVLLLVAVTNRVLLHHYPGVVAYWYCQCAHCLVKSLQQRYDEVKVDRFPADNIVYCSPGDTTLVHCVNCAPGHALRLEDIFPREQENLQSLQRLMSEPCCRALKASAPALLKHMNYRDVMNALLRKQLLTIKQAESIGAKPSHEERAHQLLTYMTHTDQKAFDVLCDELKQNDDTAWLAEELLVRAAGRNSKAGKDSDSIGGSSLLRSAKQGWRGSQESHGSVSNWSTYSRSSYGSTGSYIRRPYGSFITREPVQNYRRSASASSTPQQPRRDYIPPHNTHSAATTLTNQVTARLTNQADHIRKPRDASIPIPEVKVSEPTANVHKQEDVQRATERVDSVPAVACEVEVATTAVVQTSSPRPPQQAPLHQSPPSDGRSEYSSHSSYETDIDSYIIPDVAPGRQEMEAPPGPTQKSDDEADLHSNSITDTVNKHQQNWNHTQLTEYETDIDADIIPQVSPVPEHRDTKTTHHPAQPESQHQPEQSQRQYQLEQPDTHILSEQITHDRDHTLPLTDRQGTVPSPQSQQHQPQQPMAQQDQVQQEAVYLDTPEYSDSHVHQVTPPQPSPQHQQRPISNRNQQQPAPIHAPPQPAQQSRHRPETDQQEVNQSPEPPSFVYTETDLDRPQQQSMPRDIRVRSTGDILGQMQRDSRNLPEAESVISQSQRSESNHGRGSVSSSNIADYGRGRTPMRKAVGLIGSADLGPTHVLQDMDPIELPLRPMKRSRSSSLNKSLRRSKSKSPQAPTPEVRQTWAVPYDWEQHNSMESLSGVGTNKRRSGGFVFAASAVDVRRDTGVKRSSAPPVFTSQPTLNVEGIHQYSMPRPTGKRTSDIPQHEYVEPLPIPEVFNVSQSVPVQRRQVGLPPSGPPPKAGPFKQQPVHHEPPHAGPPQRKQPVEDHVFPMHNLPNQSQQPVSHRQVSHSGAGMAAKPFSSKFSDCSDNTESFHTGRSRTGSDDSDNATITSNMSELTFDSYHTTRSHNPSIASRALSHSSHISNADSFHTGRSYANSDIPDDVTITSDVSELTIDSFHTFNSGMTPTNQRLASPNPEDLTMVSQMSNITLDSFKSCRLSDDEVTLTSKGSSPEPPFAVDNTPNKQSYRDTGHPETQHPTTVPVTDRRIGGPPDRSNMTGQQHRVVGGSDKMPPLPQSVPVNRQLLPQHAQFTEENAPPVPPRRDLLNQPPPIPARPPTASSPPEQRPPTRSVTFADEYSQEQLKVGAPAAQVKEAKTVPLPRTDPQWSPSIQEAAPKESGKKDKKKKKKSDKKSKKTLLPYVGTNPTQGKAVRDQPGNGKLEHGPGPQYGPNVDRLHINNNRPVADVRKEMTQSYVDSIIPEPAGMRPHPATQQVYTMHTQQLHPQMHGDPRGAYQGANQNDHSKPHAYVQPYMRGPEAQGSYMDNVNANNGNKPAGGGHGKGRYPYNGGNGNGIVLVEEPYVPTTEINANMMPAHSLMGTRYREGQPRDRSSPEASDGAHYSSGSKDTAV